MLSMQVCWGCSSHVMLVGDQKSNPANLSGLTSVSLHIVSVLGQSHVATAP